MVLCRSGSFGLENVRYPFGLSLSKPGLARWFGRCACVECGGRVVAPAGDSLFFASPKNSKQKKGDPQSANPSRCEGANLRRGGCGVRRGTRFAPAARRSDNHGESDHEAWALRRPCSPRNRPVAGAASRGGTAEHPNIHTGLCFARPRVRSAWRLRPRDGAERSAAKQWPVWMSDPRVPFCACREAQGRGCVRVPKDTRTSCTDSPQLFERSAKGAQRVLRWHPMPEHHRLPVAQRRDAHSRVAFSLVTFSWRGKRKLLRRRAHTPAPALNKGTRPDQHESPGFDKLSPNGQ